MGPLCSPQELTVASILGKLIVIPVMIIFSFSDYLSLLLWCQLLHQVCFSGCSLLVHAIFWVVFCMGMAEKRRALGLWAQWWSVVSYNCRLHREAWFQEGATLPVREEDVGRVACGSFQAGCSPMLESQH